MTKQIRLGVAQQREQKLQLQMCVATCGHECSSPTPKQEGQARVLCGRGRGGSDSV